MFTFKLNGREFSSTDPIVSGQDILNIAGFDPDEQYEILLKIGDHKFEPVQLNEEVDLSQPGKEKFQVKAIKQLKIIVDGDDVFIDECFMTPNEIIQKVGLKPSEYYLKQIKGQNEITYKSDEDATSDLRIRNNMKFTTCKKAGTTVS